MDEVICDFEKVFGYDLGKKIMSLKEIMSQKKIMSLKEIRSIVKYNQEHNQAQKVTRGALSTSD